MEPALLVLWIRRSIPESEAFEGRRDSRAQLGDAEALMRAGEMHLRVGGGVGLELRRHRLERLTE